MKAMFKIELENLNTFGKGRWLSFASKELEPLHFEENCARLFSYTKNTYICLNKMAMVEDLLNANVVFIFVDNFNQLKIVGHCSGVGALCGFRGLSDGKEQNIESAFFDVAKEFFDNNSQLYKSANWKKQVEWLESLRQTKALFQQKRYAEISPQKLIDDLSYNGYDLLFEGRNDLENVKTIYYPAAKRELLSEPMLKPLLAEHLGCRTSELQVGKYNGNCKGVRFVVGDLISQHICQDCPLEKVFGRISIENYKGDFNILNTPSTVNSNISFDQYLDMENFSKSTILENVVSI